MAQRKNSLETEDVCAALPPARLPVVFWVGDELTRVSFEPPTHEPRSGACRCGACLAAALSEPREFI